MEFWIIEVEKEYQNTDDTYTGYIGDNNEITQTAPYMFENESDANDAARYARFRSSRIVRTKVIHMKEVK